MNSRPSTRDKTGVRDQVRHELEGMQEDKWGEGKDRQMKARVRADVQGQTNGGKGGRALCRGQAYVQHLQGQQQ